MASNPSNILQANRLAYQDETVDDDFVRKSLVQLRRAQLRAATDLLVSKFIQYDVLNPPDNAIDASKFVQYVVANPPDNAVDASKFVQYAVIETIPAIRPPPYAFWLRNREAWQDDTDAEEQANSQRLLTSRRIPTQTRVDDTITLSGRAANPSTGSTSIEVDKTVTGVSGTAGVGNETIQMSRPLVGQSATSHSGTETPSIGTPLTGVAVVSDVGTISQQVDADPTLTGVDGTAEVGTLGIQGDVSISGVQADANVGTISEEVDSSLTLTGVEADANVGTLSGQVNRDVSLSGVEASTGLGVLIIAGSGIHVTGVNTPARPGIPRSWLQKTLGFPPGLFDPYRGVSATPQVGTFEFISDRILNGVSATAQVGRLRLFGTLEGVEAQAAVGHIAFSPTLSLVGQRSTASVGTMFPHVGPNETNVFMPSVVATSHVGKLTTTFSNGLAGVESITDVGDLSTLIFKTGMEISELTVDELTTLQNDIGVSVRYSTNGGQSWTQPIVKSLGFQGDYSRTLSFRNTGIARSMIYEVSWACPFKTALGGGTINVEISGS